MGDPKDFQCDRDVLEVIRQLDALLPGDELLTSSGLLPTDQEQTSFEVDWQPEWDRVVLQLKNRIGHNNYFLTFIDPKTGRTEHTDWFVRWNHIKGWRRP